jgi:HEAT repeat protein
MLDQAFEALKSYDWGSDRSLLNPIEEAVLATRDEATARQELEARLAAILQTDVSRDAKDYVCRKLMQIGSAAAVPALAALLRQADHSHMARFALERIPTPDAAQALREALPQLSGVLKLGVISSLGARRDRASVTALGALVDDSDPKVASSAAEALGNIGDADALKALKDARPASAEVLTAVLDSQLACAEQLLADNHKVEALAVYKSLAGQAQPRHVRLAATRGMLLCAAKRI